jgi:hypothetical protein
MKCETYPDGTALPAPSDKGQANHCEPWPLPQKAGAEPFTVWDSANSVRQLRDGDHVLSTAMACQGLADPTLTRTW